MVTAPDTRYAERSGQHVAYQVAGQGPVDIVFIAEWWNQVEAMWDEPLVSSVLHRLASFSRLICFDKRGVGLSDPVALDESMVLDDWLDDLESVMDAAGSDRAVVVGCSGGGPLSLLFAASRPDRVSGLVLVNSYARFARAPDYSIGVPPHVIEWGLRYIEEGWGTGEHLDVLAPSLAGDAQFRTWWARYQRQALSPGSAAVIQRMLFELDVRSVLPAVRAPTLVLHRTDDAFIRIGCGHFLADHLPDGRLVALPGSDHVFFAGDADALVDEIEAFATGEHPGPSADRVLRTLLFTDVVGSTDHAVTVGDRAWKMLLDRHDAIVRREIDRFRGTEVDRAGDGFFISFDGPGRAVHCALAISRAVRDLGIEVRAGLHTGEVELRRDGISGLAVHVAARVSSLGGPGEVQTTSTVRDLVVGSGLHFADRGRHPLKGVPDEWQVFAVSD